MFYGNGRSLKNPLRMQPSSELFLKVLFLNKNNSGISRFLLIYRAACMTLNPYYLYILNCCPCLKVPGLPSMKNGHFRHI